MKIILSIAITLSFGMFPQGDLLSIELPVNEETPSYAKWGKLAMIKTKEKYPQADILDYLHRGREVKETYSIEKFKLWLRKDKREFGVFIDLKFDPETEKLIDVTFTETSK